MKTSMQKLRGELREYTPENFTTKQLDSFAAQRIAHATGIHKEKLTRDEYERAVELCRADVAGTR